jgi:hypothetical protein
MINTAQRLALALAATTAFVLAFTGDRREMLMR